MSTGLSFQDNNVYPDLNFAQKYIYDVLEYNYSGFLPEPESQEYSACTFTLNDLSVKFRAAKITPKKTGQFVALWKRDEIGSTQPHHISDAVDVYVISVRKENLAGQFVFPKSVLLRQNILSGSGKEGKRGFRVYPPWDITSNKQAQKSQKWQLEFFLEIHEGNSINNERVNSLYAK